MAADAECGICRLGTGGGPMCLGVPGWETCCLCKISRRRSSVTDASQAAYSSGLSACVPPRVICHNRRRAGLSSSVRVHGARVGASSSRTGAATAGAVVEAGSDTADAVSADPERWSQRLQALMGSGDLTGLRPVGQLCWPLRLSCTLRGEQGVGSNSITSSLSSRCRLPWLFQDGASLLTCDLTLMTQGARLATGVAAKA